MLQSHSPPTPLLAVRVGTAYARAAAAQWDPQTAVPWDAVFDVAPVLETALVQVLTYLAENETAAMLVPARLLPQIHPHFREIQQAVRGKSMEGSKKSILIAIAVVLAVRFGWVGWQEMTKESKQIDARASAEATAEAGRASGLRAHEPGKFALPAGRGRVILRMEPGDTLNVDGRPVEVDFLLEAAFLGRAPFNVAVTVEPGGHEVLRRGASGVEEGRVEAKAGEDTVFPPGATESKGYSIRFPPSEATESAAAK